MTDVLTPEQRSYNMSRIRSTDTKPEMVVRKLLHGLGLRYRLHGKALAGKPDLVFAGSRAVLFVHGCFWHMHRCKYGKPEPVTNASFWAQKREGNRARDKRNRATLRKEGWKVFEVWECHTTDRAILKKQLLPLIHYIKKKPYSDGFRAEYLRIPDLQFDDNSAGRPC